MKTGHLKVILKWELELSAENFKKIKIIKLMVLRDFPCISVYRWWSQFLQNIPSENTYWNLVLWTTKISPKKGNLFMQMKM